MQDNIRNLKDEELVNMAKKKNSFAFEELIQRYKDRIFNTSLRLLNNEIEEAEDVLQETFLKAWENMKNFKGGSTFYTWLYRIAVNLCIDRLRKSARSKMAPIDAMSEENNKHYTFNPSIENNPSDILEKQERIKLVHTALSQLEPQLKQIIILRDIEQLSYEEISNILNIPRGTVASKLYRARMELKEKITSIAGTKLMS